MMTRQQTRKTERGAEKALRHRVKVQLFSSRSEALKRRKAAKAVVKRTKTDMDKRHQYSLAAEAMIRTRKVDEAPGTPRRNVLIVSVIKGIERSYHYTKGWRVQRVPS